MGLLRSGSHKDIELVKIETEQMTLIIKGKPYNQRYEGLQEYRGLDFHEEMSFSVEGQDVIDVQVFDVDQEKLMSPNFPRPIFFENNIYQLIVVQKGEEELTFHHEHPLMRDAVTPVTLGEQKTLMGNLQFQNEVGFTFLEIRANNKFALGVTLEIFPVKLDYKKDYQQMLDEVNDEIYNLAYHLIRKTFLKARLKLDGEPSRAEFYRLITEHFDQFMQAINRIERQPHHELITSYQRVRGDQLRKQDSHTRNYLRKRSHLFTEVKKGIPIKGKQLMPTEGLRIKKDLTYDTIENRYVKWMMKRLIDKLVDLLKHVIKDGRNWGSEADPELIKVISDMKQRLTAKLKTSFWRRIGELDRSTMSLVMQMAPGYRDAFQIYLTVSKGLALQGSLYRMSVKDIAVLYEYWTFMKLGKILSKNYIMVSQDIVRANQDGLFVNLQTNRKAERVFRHPVTKEEIILTYQHHQGQLPTTNQIPDTSLQIAKKGKDFSFNYIFDAKYRIDYAQEDSSYKNKYGKPGPMEDDINTMHRYRDAIVTEENGAYSRNAFGAYVLFPWFDEEVYKKHHFYESIDKVNVGGLPFLPNATDLVEQFVERLINTSPEEIYQEGILPKGNLEEWESSLDEKVLVGLVSTTDDHTKFIQEKIYTIPSDQLSKNWQQATYIALYLKQGVGLVNGIQDYGVIKDFKLKDSVLEIEVDHWKKLEQVIKPVNYGIANYMITTLSLLKDAEELPELYMKSKDERTIWRMLRRVSDQIKIDLNKSNIDEALIVNEYNVKDVTIQIHPANQEIIISKQNDIKLLALDQLEKNPSSVFKVIVEMVSK